MQRHVRTWWKRKCELNEGLPVLCRRSPADSRITQRRSSRPSTALLPWSPSTGTGGRHPPETVVPSNWKPRSPWTGARKLVPRDAYVNSGRGVRTLFCCAASVGEPRQIVGAGRGYIRR